MKLQMSLANVLLLVTAVALSVSVWVHRTRNQWLQDRLPGLQDAAREMVVHDPSLLHGVQPHPEWFQEQKWEVYVPANQVFKLYLATEGIPADTNKMVFPNAEESIELSPGRHMIELRQRSVDKHEVEIFVDDESAILVQKSNQWRPKNNSTSWSSDFHTCESFSSDKRVRLINMRIRDGNKPYKQGEVLNGILLWISSTPKAGKQ